jgi:hypothetical protein
LRRVLAHPWLGTIVLATAVCVAYLVAVFANWGDVADRSLYANLGLIPIGLTAAILATRASLMQEDSRSRWAWRLLGAGLLCFFAGDVLFFVYANVIANAPFPSPADAGYLAYYPLAFAGLLFFPSVPVRKRRRLAVYLGGGGSLLVAAGAVVYFFLMPTLQSSRDDPFVYALSAGYPVGDLFLLGGMAWILLRRVPGRASSIALLAVGLTAGLAADLIYGYESVQGAFESGGLPDALYMISWTFFAWAGFMAGMRRRAER